MTGAHPLDDLVEEMLPVATELAVCVRDRDTEGTHAAIAQVLGAGDQDRIAALVVALAVMIPDDVPFGELVAWTHGQEQLPYGELVIAPSEKWCGSCSQIRPRRDFVKDKSRKDGLYARCKVCVSEEHQKRKIREQKEAAA